MLAYMNRRLSSLYIRDALTGIYNRMGYHQIGEEVFRISKENQRKLLILFADLDCLKYLNDTYGHEYGDKAICAVANALLKYSARDAIPARTGGDEFVLIQTYQSDEATEEMLQYIHKALEDEGRIQQLPVPLSISIGAVVTDPGSLATLEEYVKAADEKMYEEKIKKKAVERSKK